MDGMRWLEEGDEFPPPGRIRLTLLEAERWFVDQPCFADSTSRADIWAGLIEYLGEFVRLEDIYESELGGLELVRFLWLGGSFVSRQKDPRNLDLCVAVDSIAKERLFGRPGSGWLTRAFHRDRCLDNYRLSPLLLPYRPVVSPFKSHELERPDIDYLRERGSWDDWFQRLRDPGKSEGAPTLSTVPARRGYVEVVL